MLRIEGVTKVFLDRREGKGVIALKDVRLDVKDNEFVVIIGPSGCGKSTLLNLVAGFERPTDGRILMNGDEVKGPSPRRGMVFQDHSLYPWMSARENIEFGLCCNGMTAIRKREIAERYLELTGLLDFGDSRPDQLSGGMRQRLAVARTLALEPELLLMDEPFGSLDQDTRRKMDRELLEIWRRERKTVLFVTHDLEETVMLGERVVLMSSRPGTILEEWRIRDEHPRDPLSPGMCEIKREISYRLMERSAQEEGSNTSWQMDEETSNNYGIGDGRDPDGNL
jgi:NitT/TauT family transport system ATP-binding protein